MYDNPVVPHAGDVDRNFTHHQQAHHEKVVPHAGDVDRNVDMRCCVQCVSVVPHAGDVDRNRKSTKKKIKITQSSPTRGTWIEIGAGRRSTE